MSALPWGRPQNTAMVSVQASCTHALAGGNVICAAAHGPLRTRAQHGLSSLSVDHDHDRRGAPSLLPDPEPPWVWSLSSAGR